MEFMDVAARRRAVRDYTDEPLDPASIQSLIEVAVQAPSAKNLQPWSFWVVMGRAQVEELGGKVKEWLLTEPDGHGMYSPIEHLASSPAFSPFYHAPALILIVATSQVRQATLDCYLAAELLMLAARDRGLGTCWIGSSRPWFDLPSTKALLNIPTSHCVAAPLIVGYPREWPVSHGRNQPIVHWWAHLAEPNVAAQQENATSPGK